MDDFVELFGFEIATTDVGDPSLVGDATQCDEPSSSSPLPVNSDRYSGAYGSYCVIA